MDRSDQTVLNVVAAVFLVWRHASTDAASGVIPSLPDECKHVSPIKKPVSMALTRHLLFAIGYVLQLLPRPKSK
jgi:hypothetical protein